MIFLFFYWANRLKTCAVRNNTNLLSALWLSAEVEPCSGLMTPLPASDGCLVYFGPLFIPSCSCRRSPGGRAARSTRPFLTTQGLGSVQTPAHQLPLYSSCSLRPKCGFGNWCNQLLNSATAVAVGVLAAESGQEKQKRQDSSMTHIDLIKIHNMCCFLLQPVNEVQGYKTHVL